MQKGEFEPGTDYQQRLKDSSLTVFQRIYFDAVEDQIDERLKPDYEKTFRAELIYDTEKERFSVFMITRYDGTYHNYMDTIKSFINNIPLSEAKIFKERWEESSRYYKFQDWCFVGIKSQFNRFNPSQLFPKVIECTVNGQTYILPVHEISRLYHRPEIFTSKDFREVSLAFNSLDIENEYLRDVVLRYSDIKAQIMQQIIDDPPVTPEYQPVTYSLSGGILSIRSVVKESPLPEYNGQGKVVVIIKVNSDGKVIEANVGEGTTIRDAKLWKAAEKAAKKTRFSVSENLRDRFSGSSRPQSGTITYMFK
jgi:TonB family protein